jgi:hypothetical protein
MSVVIHLMSANPGSGEATLGCQNGSLLIDFVGQMGPTTRTHLLILDMFLLILQLSILSIVTERSELEKSSCHLHRDDDFFSAKDNIQALDAEERGLSTDSGFCSRLTSPISYVREQSYIGRMRLGEFWLLDIVKLRR